MEQTKKSQLLDCIDGILKIMQDITMADLTKKQRVDAVDAYNSLKSLYRKMLEER